MHVNFHFLLWGVWALCCLTPTIAKYLGKERWNLYGCLNFRLAYCICNWCWISIVALKMESNFIVEYINYINQAYCSCNSDTSFVTMLFCTTRIWCSSIWAIDMMAMGKLELYCVQKHIHGWRHYLPNVVDLFLHH